MDLIDFKSMKVLNLHTKNCVLLELSSVRVSCINYIMVCRVHVIVVFEKSKSTKHTCTSKYNKNNNVIVDNYTELY